MKNDIIDTLTVILYYVIIFFLAMGFVFLGFSESILKFL